MNILYTEPVEGAVMNVEKLFSYTKLVPDDTVKRFIKEIEKGKYLSSTSFIDRFGYKLPISSMSTGCKAAIAIYLNPGVVVSGYELGYNSLSSILKHCDNTQLMIYDQCYEMNTVNPTVNAAVKYKGHIFSTYTEFAEYMVDGWPMDPAEWEDCNI